MAPVEVLVEVMKRQIELLRNKIQYLENQNAGQEKFIGYLTEQFKKDNQDW